LVSVASAGMAMTHAIAGFAPEASGPVLDPGRHHSSGPALIAVSPSA
jgi:hypothetical protein